VLDFGALDHAPEQEPRSSLGQHLIGEADEGIMHVVIGNRGSNPVDVGDRHHASSRPRGFRNYRISILRRCGRLNGRVTDRCLDLVT
jgi:hypothetical protein